VLGEWPAPAEALALACVVGGVLLSARRVPSITTTNGDRTP
jgi:drug/metabolite transporter (DMT)-like permease